MTNLDVGGSEGHTLGYGGLIVEEEIVTDDLGHGYWGYFVLSIMVDAVRVVAEIQIAGRTSRRCQEEM